MDLLPSIHDEPEVAAAPAFDDRRRRILGSFWRDEIEPVPTSLGYRLGLFAVAVAMVTLPVLYVAFVAGVAFGLYRFFAADVVGTIGLTGIPALLSWVTVAFVGLVLVVFLIKPIFLPGWQDFRPRPIRRDQEPLLFSFVELICNSLGAPFPRRILVTCDVNAAAGLRRGWLSLFGEDLVLYLGLPLVAGISVQQLAGIIAHELGHFSQNTAMGVGYVIRSVNQWFARIVFERDAFDVWLYRELEQNDGFIGFLFKLCELAVRATRRVLWIFMMGGHAVSCFLARQMEFDADLHETRLVGADTFEQSCWDLVTLDMARQKSFADLDDSWKQGRLAGNFARLVVDNRGQLPAAWLDKLRQGLASEKTSLWNTHPAVRERVRHARNDGATPIFSCDLPASALFRDFDELATKVTFDFYRSVLGPEVKKGDLYSLHEVVRHRDRTSVEREALRRYFRETVTVLRPLVLDAGRWRQQLPTSEAALKTVAAARERIEKDLPETVRDAERYAAAYEVLLDSYRVEALLAAGLPVAGQRTAAQQLGAQVQVDLERLDSKLHPREEVFGKRLFAALHLMRSEEVSRKVLEVDQFRKDASRYLRAIQKLNDIHPQLVDLWQSRAELAVLVPQLPGDGQLQQCFRATLRRIYESVVGIYGALDRADYPLDHADEKTTLRSYLVPELPDDHDSPQLDPMSELLLERAFDVYFKVLARLAYIAESLERGAGLEPLPPPKKLRVEDPPI